MEKFHSMCSLADVVNQTVYVVLTTVLMCQICSGAGSAPPRLPDGFQARHRQVFTYGGAIRLACQVISHPSQTLFTWFKDNQEVGPGWDRYRIGTQPLGGNQFPIPAAAMAPGNAERDAAAGASSVTSFLRIKDAIQTDSGVYRCQATNGFGSVDVIFHVYVTSTADVNETNIPPSSEDIEENGVRANEGKQPKFTDFNSMVEHVTFQTGSTERLTCASSGRPRPEIAWFKDGHRISPDIPGPGESTTTALVDRHELVLIDIRKTDAGMYRCMVSNTFGNINFTYNVEVIDGDDIPHPVNPDGNSADPGQRPTFLLSHPHNVTIWTGDTAVFMCYVKSPTDPHIKWLKHIEKSSDDAAIYEQDVNEDGDYGRTITVNGLDYVVIGDSSPNVVMATVRRSDGSYLSKLIIRHVTSREEGMYVCSSTNRAGYTYREAFLTLRTRNRQLLTPSSVVNAPTVSFLNTLLPFIVASVVLTMLFMMTLVVFIVWRRQGAPCGKRSVIGKELAANGGVSGSSIDGGRHRYDNELSVKIGPDAAQAPPIAATSESSSSSSSSTSFPPEMAVGIKGVTKNQSRGSVRQLLIDKTEPSRRSRRQSHSCEVSALLRQPSNQVDGGRTLMSGVHLGQGQGQCQPSRHGLLPAVPAFRPSATASFETDVQLIEPPLRRSVTLNLHDSATSSSSAAPDPSSHKLFIAPTAAESSTLRNGSTGLSTFYATTNGRSPPTLGRNVRPVRDTRTASATVDGDLPTRMTSRQTSGWHPVSHQTQQQELITSQQQQLLLA